MVKSVVYAALSLLFCGSELAREKRPDTAFIQTTRVIVDVLREQARSYRGMHTLEGMPSHGEAPNVRGKSLWLLGAFPSDLP
ncbi:hypothetical protein D3C78_1655840 [compost metagenome]